MAGLRNKDREFWEGLREWDVITPTETWTDGKGWNRVREGLPGGYVWEGQKAIRKNRKGRAMGGMIMGIRKELLEKGTKIESVREGIMMGKVRIWKEKWRITGVYIGKNGMEGTLQVLEKWMEGKETGTWTIIGGDFNARTGRKGGGVTDGEEEGAEGRGRQSKDSKTNKEGRLLVDFIEEREWMILNRNTKGDKRGEYTFTGGGRMYGNRLHYRRRGDEGKGRRNESRG